MADDKKIEASKKEYEKKRVHRPISFNTETESDLLEHSRKLDFSQWVKNKLKEDMKNN